MGGGSQTRSEGITEAKLRVSAQQRRMQITLCDPEAGVMEHAFPGLVNSGGGWSSWVVWLLRAA